jgi:hypothetical protein
MSLIVPFYFAYVEIFIYVFIQKKNICVYMNATFRARPVWVPSSGTSTDTSSYQKAVKYRFTTNHLGSVPRLKTSSTKSPQTNCKHTETNKSIWWWVFSVCVQSHVLHQNTSQSFFFLLLCSFFNMHQHIYTYIVPYIHIYTYVYDIIPYIYSRSLDLNVKHHSKNNGQRISTHA